MSKVIDYILNLCKWPIACFLLFCLPALYKSFDFFDFFTLKFYALGVGIAFFCFTLLAAGYNMRHSMQIIAHELTHTFFAYLTLHKAGRIRLNPDGSGGSMLLKGYGNWLISLSPYFFPLFAFFYMLIMSPLAEATDEHLLLYAILGYFLAYYWSTVLSQVHVGQTDIIEEGYVFSAIVIVSANMFVTGAILAYCSQLWQGVKLYLLLVNKLNIDNIKYIENLIASYF